MTDNKVHKVSEKRGKVINQNKKYDIENCHRTISIWYQKKSKFFFDKIITIVNYQTTRSITKHSNQMMLLINKNRDKRETKREGKIWCETTKQNKTFRSKIKFGFGKKWQKIIQARWQQKTTSY